jgi:voltage-gated potassium channel
LTSSPSACVEDRIDCVRVTLAISGVPRHHIFMARTYVLYEHSLRYERSSIQEVAMAKQERTWMPPMGLGTVVLAVDLVALVVYVSLAARVPKIRSPIVPFAFTGTVIILIAVSMLVLLSRGVRHVSLASVVAAVFIDLAILVCAFTTAYYSYGGRGGEIPKISTHLDSLYFAITILSTVGFGDITATGQGARLLVTMQMVLDFSYLAMVLGIVLNLITSAAASSASTQRDKPGS